MNKQRSFNNKQKKKLGLYIYAYRNPIDMRIFRIGQGRGDDVFEIFNRADKASYNDIPNKDFDFEVVPILDIWQKGKDVEWFIIEYNIESNKAADNIENVIYNTLNLSTNRSPHRNNDYLGKSYLNQNDIIEFTAYKVNPKEPLIIIFFPINRKLDRKEDPYKATRGGWAIEKEFRDLKNTYAIGLNVFVSYSSYKIDSWEEVGEGLYDFISPNHPNPQPYQPLLYKNFENIVSQCPKYFNKGINLIIEFDGKGNFRNIKDYDKKEVWYKCRK